MINNNFKKQNNQGRNDDDYDGILNKEIAKKILNDKEGKELFYYAEEIGKKLAKCSISVS